MVTELAVPEGLLPKVQQEHGSGLHGVCHQPLCGPAHGQHRASAAPAGMPIAPPSGFSVPCYALNTIIFMGQYFL